MPQRRGGVLAGLFKTEKVYAVDSTFYTDPAPESTTTDGAIIRDENDTWANVRSATAGSYLYDTYAGLDVRSVYASPNYRIDRLFFLFNTSTLSSGAIISSAILSLKGNEKAEADSGASTQNIVSSSPASNTQLVVGDYDQVGATSFASKSYAAFSTTAYNDYTLDSNGISNISLTGISKFAVRIYSDFANIAPTGNNYVGVWTADQPGTSEDPKLVVTYTVPASPKQDVIWFE